VDKGCEIGPGLLLITKRKSHIGFQMTCESLTSDDLEGGYARFSMENWPRHGNGERYGLPYY